MPKQPKTFFRYRAFSASTLSLLCEDKAYFSHPGNFNDPLDCSPTLNCDSSNEELRNLLEFFIRKRVEAQVVSHLNEAGVKGDGVTKYAQRRAFRETKRNLADIAYHATNPDYDRSIEGNESWLLLCAIEDELHRWYERGVCCFSTSYSNPLLWSHYGDQHQGICVGYTAERNPVPELHRVVYGGSRAINTSTLCAAFLRENRNAAAEVDRDVLLRKARGWKYESEWRLIGQQGLHSSPLLLTEVTFGLRCSSSVMHAVIKALEGRENDVKFYEMYAVRNSFALRRRTVNIDELQISRPVTARSGVEIFGEYQNIFSERDDVDSPDSSIESSGSE